MKKLKSIIIWVMVSMLVQFGGLLYIDRYYLTTDTTFKVTKVEKTEAKKVDIKIPIPNGAEQVAVSYDAKYLSYYYNGTIKIINTNSGQEKSVKVNDGMKVSMYKWLPDRDRMTIAESPSSTGKGSIILSYYDASKDMKDKIEDLTWADSKSEVEDIQVSTLTNVYFIKVKRSGTRSNIYRLDIMKNINKVNTDNYVVGNISILHLEDKLIYEDSLHNKVYATGVKHPISINGSENQELLGVDDDDNIYLGGEIDGKITKICYGNLQKTTDQWQVISLQSPSDKKDIFISSDGDIHVNNNLKGQVQSLKTNKITAYNGIFLQMCDKGIVSNDGGNLCKVIYK